MEIATQIFGLIILSMVVACIAWTVTQEEIFREWNEYCKNKCENRENLLKRKFFYVFTCEYCFSHWVTILILILSNFQLLINDWRGYILAFFTITWLANFWMITYHRLRVEIKHENALAEKVKEGIED